MEGLEELPALDIELYREALHRTSTSAAFTPRIATTRPPEIGSRLDSAASSLPFSYRGEYRRLPLALVRALGFLGKAEARALTEEVLHLVRFFQGLTEQPCLQVDLVFGEAIPSPDAPAITLLCPLLDVDGGRDAWDGLRPRTVLVAKGEISKLLAGGGSPAAGRHLVLSVSTASRPYFFEAPVAPAPAPACVAARDVVLVSMPFGPLVRPSLGLSSLAATLDGPSCEILYFTLRFAERVGAPFYAWVCDSKPSEESLAGEWIMSGGASGADGAEDYVAEILRDVPDFVIDDLLLARSKVDSFLAACVDEVVARRPRVVGFTSMFQQHQASLALAERLKVALPGAIVVFGGANCEGAMGLETVRSFEFVDAVVSGEGEQVFPEIVSRLLGGRSLRGLRGVHTREDRRPSAREGVNTPLVLDLDGLPQPDFEDFFRQWRSYRFLASYQPGLLWETSRGCWWGERHHCTFCGLNGTGMRFRSKTAERALAEITELCERYRLSSVSLVDNILDLGYFRSLVPGLAERKLEVELFWETKSNLKKEQIRLLREAGVTTIQPGVESFSDDVLRIMRKGVTGLQNIQLLKWCLELGVRPCWNLIWGFPGEPPEAYEWMAEIIPLLHHLAPPEACGPLRLDRFSPNFDHADELGLCEVAPWRAYRHLYALADEEVANLAYYFAYRHRDGRKPEVYSQGVRDRVAEWKAAFDDSHLLYIDKGSDLLLWDLRRVAARRVTILSGVEREIYLACDRIRSLDSLRRAAVRISGAAWRREEIEEMLLPWIRDGLILRQGSRVLALAVPGAAGMGGAGAATDPSSHRPQPTRPAS